MTPDERERLRSLLNLFHRAAQGFEPNVYLFGPIQQKDCTELARYAYCAVSALDRAESDLAAMRARAERAEAACAMAMPYVEYFLGEETYGRFMGGDPRRFRPDPECSTEEERAKWEADCAAWERGEEQHSVKFGHEFQGNAMLSYAGYGWGTYRTDDGEGAADCFEALQRVARESEKERGA